jgi:hypothetical protein
MKLEGYTGKVSKTDFGNYSGKFTSTVFLADSGDALSATDEGYVIVWGSQFSTVLLDDPTEANMKIASKVLCFAVEYIILFLWIKHLNVC